MRVCCCDLNEASEVAAQAGLPQVVLEAIPVPILAVDRQCRLVWANAQARAYLPALEQEPRATGVGNLLRCLYADCQPGGCGAGLACKDCVISRTLRRAFAGQAVTREKATVQVRTADGHDTVHLQVTAAPLRFEATDLALLIIQDISELIRLRSLIPICASCKRVRDDSQYWRSVDEYFHDRLDVDFSHGICPSCRDKLYPDLAV